MDLNATDFLLMHATKNGNHNKMKIILKPGPSSGVCANVDAFDGEDTPLSAAIQRKDYEAMRILLAAEANPHINLESEDRYDPGDGATPFMLALSDPAAFAIILADSRFGTDMGRRNWKGKPSVDCIPDNLRSEIYSLLALYFGDEKKNLKLKAIADAVGAPKARHASKAKPTPEAKPASSAKPAPKPRRKATKAK